MMQSDKKRRTGQELLPICCDKVLFSSVVLDFTRLVFCYVSFSFRLNNLEISLVLLFGPK